MKLTTHTIRGFTLIELLVVIAIIGVLSSVAIASLGAARNKGKDSAIKLNLANMRGQAEIFFDVPGNYGTAFAVGACASTPGTLFSDPRMQALITQAGNTSIESGGMAQVSCVSTANAWAVSAPLVTTPTNSWCVDSQGASRSVTPAGADRGFNGTECK